VLLIYPFEYQAQAATILFNIRKVLRVLSHSPWLSKGRWVTELIDIKTQQKFKETASQEDNGE